MKTPFLYQARALLVAAVLPLGACFASESPSLLLQKGIYAEEIERNLDSAIKIYEQVAAEAAANRAVVAQAHYRLGVCHQKKGNKEQAIGVLNELLKQFPAEAALGQKARELLAGLGQAPAGQITRRQLPPTFGWGMTVSLDGRLLAFGPKGSNRGDIYEFATGKTWTAVQWAEGEKGTWITFSPDGRQIAYTLSGAFCLAKVDGSEAKQIHNFKGSGEATLVYDWSLDGRSLVVGSLDKDKNRSLGVLDIATGNIREIKRWPPSEKQRPESANLTANGRFVAYTDGPKGSNGKIKVIDVESATEITLVGEEVDGMWGWSLAGDQFLFLSSRTGAKGLWAIPVWEGKPTGEPELVAANLGSITPLGFTSDGSFYYLGKLTRTNVYLATANFETGEISGQPHRVTARFPGAQSNPVWSKDGQRLMLAILGDQGARFVAVSMATGKKENFPAAGSFGHTARPGDRFAWSHDGTFLLVTAWRGVMGIHRDELATGATETLVKNKESETAPWKFNGHPRFSPDGDSFYYHRREFIWEPSAAHLAPKGIGYKGWKDCIIRRDLRTRREEIVYASPDSLQLGWPYELSPDGEHLAIVASEHSAVTLKVRSVNGAETKELMRMAPRESLTSLAWTPDGKRLVYTKRLPGKSQADDEPSEVWSTAVNSGQSVKLDLSMPDMASLSIHPDGRQIAFRTGLSSDSNLWVMEGLMSKPVPSPARISGN